MLSPLLVNGQVVLYVDDILIATEGTLGNHLKLVDKVLQTLSEAGFKLNKEKAQITKKEVHNLGYTLTQH